MSDLRRIEAALLAAIDRLQIRKTKLGPFERIKLRSLTRNLRTVQALLAVTGGEAGRARTQPHHHAPGDLCDCGTCLLSGRTK